MANSRWSSTIIKLLLAVTLPMNIRAYRVIMVPILGRSHVISMAVMAEGLANRGHMVTFFIGEGFPLNLPELRNRSEISVVRFKDDDTDYGAFEKNITKTAFELGGGINIKQLPALIRKSYVNHILGHVCVIIPFVCDNSIQYIKSC